MKVSTIQKNIPNRWQEKSLGDVCDIVNGSTPKRTVSEYWENGNIPWFTVEDIRSSGRIINKTNQSITEKALKETSVKLLPEDSVLLCCTASLGEVAFTKIPLTTNQQFNGLVSKDKENLYPYYLFYSAQKLGESLKSKSGKTTISFLSVGTLSKEKILLPPLEEQQKIAEILGAVDEDIAKTQELIDTTEKLKKGLMQELFTTQNGWEEKSLSDVLDYERPDQYIVKSVSYSNKSKTPVLTANKSFILGYTDEEFGIYKNIPAIIFDDFTTDSKFVDFPFKIKSSAIKILKERDISINLRFVFEKMKSINFQTGSHKRFYISQYQNLKILLPPLEEQQKIADILSSIDEKISVNKKLKEKLITLKKGLMQDLLSGRVRVNIN